ncbi:hypothetical protein LTR53_000138 [Teratosphaeriaceae sp. CCFEE 6253]|nr:hypothetical protein LTR53_000138 [Teratosphaeriaceae sp. CCFEE 6253]
MDGPVIALKQTLARLFQTESFTDFTIICGPNTFKVHTAVISQSEYFATACASGRFEEGEQGRITLKARGSGDDNDGSCDDPDAVKHMIHYFYHLDYNATPTENPSRADDSLESPIVDVPRHEASLSSKRGRDCLSTADTQSDSHRATTVGTMTMHALVFAAATKYQVPALQGLAASKFIDAVEVDWDDDDFAQAAHVVYTTTAEEVRTLRDEVARVINDHWTLLENPAVEAVVCSINGLAYELLKRLRQDLYAPSTPRAKRVKANTSIDLLSSSPSSQGSLGSCTISTHGPLTGCHSCAIPLCRRCGGGSLCRTCSS